MQINMTMKRHIDGFFFCDLLDIMLIKEERVLLTYRFFYLLTVEHPSASGDSFLTHVSSIAANLCQRSVQVDQIITPLVV